MRTINNQFEKKETIPRVTITDSNDVDVVFGDTDIDSEADYGRVFELSVSMDIDQDSWQADMSFNNHENIGHSLDPLDSNSQFNDGTISTNLMDEYNHVKIEISKDEGSNWYNIFEGYVGTVTARRKVDKDDIIDFSPYDKSKPLKDVIILEDAPNQPYEYYNWDALDLIDKILDDNGFDLTLDRTASDDPKKTVDEYLVKNTNVWDALKEVISGTGYKLMFRPVNNSFELIVADPLREEISVGDIPDVSFSSGFDLRRIEQSDRDVRTKVIVFYINERNGARERVEVENSDTLEKYGADNYGGEKLDRTMVLKETDNSPIRSKINATDFANAAIHDLAAPSPDTELHFHHTVPGIEIYDKVEAGGIGDYTVQIGVSSVSYSWSAADPYGSSSLRGTAWRVIGARSYWLNRGYLPDDIEANKGDRKPPPKPDRPPLLEKEVYDEKTGISKIKAIAIGEHCPAWDTDGYQFRYRICDTSDGTCDEWKYPDTVKHPQKTISGLQIGDDLELEVEYSVIDWENTEWSGLPGDSPYSDTATIPLHADIIAPSAPSNLTATKDVQGISVEWDKPTTSEDGSDLSDLSTFIVYWNSTSGFDKDSADGKKDVGKTEAWTQRMPANTTRYYQVTAIDTSSNESSPSNEDGATSESSDIDDIQVYGWSSDLSFTSDSSTQVSWSSGTLQTGDGQSFSIDSGDTGSMSSATYIYFDLDTSTTTLQTSTTSSDSVGSNKILVATAQNHSDGAKYQVFGGGGGQFLTADELAANTITANEIASNTITAGQISAGTITADEIKAGTITANEIDADTITATEISAGTITASELSSDSVTADKIDVDNLSAIESNMGTLYTGKIYMSSGDIQIGENAIGTTDGIYIEGGHIQVKESGGRTIFDTSEGFTVNPIANDMVRDGGSGNLDSGSTGTILSFTKPILTGIVAIAKDDSTQSETGSWCELEDDSGSVKLYQEEAGTPGSTRLKTAPWAWDALIYPLPNWLPQGTGKIYLRNGDNVDRNYHYWVIYND